MPHPFERKTDGAPADEPFRNAFVRAAVRENWLEVRQWKVGLVTLCNSQLCTQACLLGSAFGAGTLAILHDAEEGSLRGWLAVASAIFIASVILNIFALKSYSNNTQSIIDDSGKWLRTQPELDPVKHAKFVQDKLDALETAHAYEVQWLNWLVYSSYCLIALGLLIIWVGLIAS